MKKEVRLSAAEPGQKLLYCPLAIIGTPEMKTKGKYPKGYPEGAVVHFTAGRTAESSLSYGTQQGYCFFVIAKDGRILQNFRLDRWGYHAGVSSWKGRSGVSQYFVGIEIDNAGRLDKKPDGFYAWYGKKVEDKLTRTVKAKDNVQKGTYEAYTKEQEESLTQLLIWLKDNNPGVFKLENVVGHDEVAPTRKNDPGGALSMTMPEYRTKLLDIYARKVK